MGSSFVINESWLAAAELGAHPPAILRMAAASRHKEKAVEGALLCLLDLEAVVRGPAKNKF